MAIIAWLRAVIKAVGGLHRAVSGLHQIPNLEAAIGALLRSLVSAGVAAV
jgi:hypothetical protein